MGRCWTPPAVSIHRDWHQKIIGTEPASFTERWDDTRPHQLSSRYRSGQINVEEASKETVSNHECLGSSQLCAGNNGLLADLIPEHQFLSIFSFTTKYTIDSLSDFMGDDIVSYKLSSPPPIAAQAGRRRNSAISRLTSIGSLSISRRRSESSA